MGTPAHPRPLSWQHTLKTHKHTLTHARTRKEMLTSITLPSLTPSGPWNAQPAATTCWYASEFRTARATPSLPLLRSAGPQPAAAAAYGNSRAGGASRRAPAAAGGAPGLPPSRSPSPRRVASHGVSTQSQRSTVEAYLHACVCARARRKRRGSVMLLL